MTSSITGLLIINSDIDLGAKTVILIFGKVCFKIAIALVAQIKSPR